MLTLVVIIIIIVSILLGAIILIQNPKGGGVSATFAGTSQQIFGASKSTDIVEKATWTLAALLMVLAIGSAVFAPKNTTAPTEQLTTQPNTTNKNDEAADLEKRIKETGAGNATVPINTTPANQQTPPPATPAGAPAK